MNNLLILLIILSSCRLFASPERISEKEMDRSKTMLIWATPGRSTIIDFPCEISHTTLGLPDDIKIVVGPDNKRTITLWVVNESSQPTNMIVKCDEEHYVFDINPNKDNHQDYIEIIDDYDSRVFRRRKKILTSSKNKNTYSKERIKKKVLYSSKAVKQIKSSKNNILESLNRNSKPRRVLFSGVKK